MGTIQGDHGPIPHCPCAFLAEIEPDSFLKQSNIAILGGKCHFWLELGGSQEVGVGGGVGVIGTIHGDPEPIPHTLNAF